MGQRIRGYWCALAIVTALAMVAPANAEDDAASAKVYSRTNAERRIEAALDQPLKAPLEFVEAPLNQIIQVLAEDYDIPVMIDSPALDAVASSPEAEVTVSIGNVSLRSALDLMLRSASEDLTYIVDNEVLLLTTKEEESRRLQTRVYRVDDLIVGDPSQSVLDSEPDFDSLIDLVVSTISHESWLENGTGQGEIQPFQPGILVIAQTRAIHDEVGRLFSELRQARADILHDLKSVEEGVFTKPQTRSISLSDEPLRDSVELRDMVREAIVSSVDWNSAVEGESETNKFLYVLPNRIIVRHTPQVLRQVERVAREITGVPSTQGFVCGVGCYAQPPASASSSSSNGASTTFQASP